MSRVKAPTVRLFAGLGNPWDIEAEVRARLADSLTYVFDQAEPYLTVERARVEAAASRIRASKQDPGVVARYFDLIFAIEANRFAEADKLLSELIERTSRPASFAIVPYARDQLGSDYERFPALLFAEFTAANPMASPPPARAAAAVQQMRDAIAIVGRIDRDIHDEIEAFLSRIYLAVGSTNPAARRFGGVTSLLVWGASFINLDLHPTRWDAVQFLVHEITHSLLLGLSCDEPLVENPSEEGYHSPLRADPRPMDGIFHATLVCARLATFNRAWLESGLLEQADRARTEESVVRNTHRFRDGLAVIDEHGKLSERGRRMIERSSRELPVLA
jgi:hypothetical protein